MFIFILLIIAIIILWRMAHSRLSYLKNHLEYNYILLPLGFFAALFTNRVFNRNGGYDKDYIQRPVWDNTFQKIVFGIFGRIGFVLFYLTIIFTILCYRPYNDGYLVKSNSYQAGDVIVYKQNKELHSATVKEFLVKEGGPTLLLEEGGEISVFPSFISSKYVAKNKGIYRTDSQNHYYILLQSIKGFFQNILFKIKFLFH